MEYRQVLTGHPCDMLNGCLVDISVNQLLQQLVSLLHVVRNQL